MFQDFKCPYCSEGFIEQMGPERSESIPNPENTEGQSLPRSVTTGQITDIGIDDDPSPPVSITYVSYFHV